MTAEVIDIRQFDASDFAPLIEAESCAWGSGLRWDYRASAELISTCLAEKRLSGYALIAEGRIVGYSFFVYEGGKGLIGDLYVNSHPPETRDHAVRLAEHVLETLTATPGITRIEAQLPHFAIEELAGTFRAHGFTAYGRRFMALALPERPDSHVAAPALEAKMREFAVEPWERRHDRQVAELVYHTYCGHVDATINDQYASLGGAARLIDNIVHLRGCGEQIPRASLVAIERRTQKLAALVSLTAVRSTTAHIPQVAVAPEFQGRGLGRALMETSFREAERQGYREVSLTVTDRNRGAVNLYERIGFVTFRTFGAFVWQRRAP